MIGKIEIDIEVDPLALRRYFKLLIPANVLKVGAYKQLSNIPIPEAEGLVHSVRRRLEIKLLVGTCEKEIKIVLRPSGTYPGPVSGNRTAPVIAFKVDRGCPSPESRLRVRIQHDVVSSVFTFECAAISGAGID